MYAESKGRKKPACMSNQCEIVDIAPVLSLNKKVSAFFQVESLDTSPAYAEFARKILRDSGLAEESADTILEMRSALLDYREYEAKKSSPRKR
jgi:hypothetical protein